MNTLSQLFEQAAAARTKAYVPYSRFAVGAAILSIDGKIYAGMQCRKRFLILAAPAPNKGQSLP